jgi:hypothetical protein
MMLGLAKVIGLTALVTTVRGLPAFPFDWGRHTVTVTISLHAAATVCEVDSPVSVTEVADPVSVSEVAAPATVTVTTTSTGAGEDPPVTEAAAPITVTVTTTSIGAGEDLAVVTPAAGSYTETVVVGVATITSTSTSTFMHLEARQDQKDQEDEEDQEEQNDKDDIDVLVTVTQSHQGEPLATHTVDVPKDSVYLLPPVTQAHGPVTTVTVTEFAAAASTPVVIETVYADPDPTTTITETAPQATHTLNVVDLVPRAVDEDEVGDKDEVYTTETVTPDPVTVEVVTHTAAGPKVETVVVTIPSSTVFVTVSDAPAHTGVIPKSSKSSAPQPVVTYKTTKIPSKSGGPHTGPPIITPIHVGSWEGRVQRQHHDEHHDGHHDGHHDEVCPLPTIMVIL